MSTICSDKITNSSKISSSPEEILFQTNNAIKETLKHGNLKNENKEGMEIALLKVNKKTKEINFSGANRFLWIVKNNSNDIIEIKATKASIASTTLFDFKYELHNLQLEKGDTMYMTSDGYVDQFGGPNGKKFMTKNLKSLILSNSEKSIEQQGIILKDTINNWMKDYEQVDDLLVIGIRL